jgi:hypothetical protein
MCDPLGEAEGGVGGEWNGHKWCVTDEMLDRMSGRIQQPI